MDFIQFLDVSHLNNTNKQNKTTLNKKIHKPAKDKNDKKTKTNTENDNIKIDTIDVKDTTNMILCDNINKGDYVSIIHNPNSVYNYYKGYVCEIIEYNKKGKFAIICLLGLPHFKTLKIPITHLVKRHNVA